MNEKYPKRSASKLLELFVVEWRVRVVVYV